MVNSRESGQVLVVSHTLGKLIVIFTQQKKWFDFFLNSLNYKL